MCRSYSFSWDWTYLYCPHLQKQNNQIWPSQKFFETLHSCPHLHPSLAAPARPYSTIFYNTNGRSPASSSVCSAIWLLLLTRFLRFIWAVCISIIFLFIFLFVSFFSLLPCYGSLGCFQAWASLSSLEWVTFVTKQLCFSGVVFCHGDVQKCRAGSSRGLCNSVILPTWEYSKFMSLMVSSSPFWWGRRG